MIQRILLLVLFLFGSISAYAQDAGSDESDETAATAESEPQVAEEEAEPAAASGDGTRVMSGMSVLGNEEAPKALVIIPWKSSEIGSDLGLSDTLDDRATPVDKDVFLRELRFYEIRSGN